MFQIRNGADSNGQAKCDLAANPISKIKEILGVQEKIRDEQIQKQKDNSR